MKVLVIGGGIAGVSAAYFLSLHADVEVWEAEATAAYHTTGRSAAQYLVNYGSPPVRRLTLASRAFLEDPAGLADFPILDPRPLLTIGSEAQVATLTRRLREGASLDPTIIRVERGRALEMVPVLRPEAVAWGVYEPHAMDIDVSALHQAFIRGIRASGGRIRLSTPVEGLRRHNGVWEARSGPGLETFDVVVNAAGAWGDRIAGIAGVSPLRLTPMRRTAFMVTAPEGATGWPLVEDADHRWYFKPDNAQLLCSPADETPMEPCDVRPDPMDIALGIERINAATTLGIRSVRSSWAGLRTFAPDRNLALGPDSDIPSFVWCVGQGGVGIQTSPAAGQLIAATVAGIDGPRGIDPLSYSPARFRAG